jgi:hypothetical protein
MNIVNNNFDRYEITEIKANTNYKISFVSDGTFNLQFGEGNFDSSVIKPLTKPLKGIASMYNINIKTNKGGVLFLSDNHKTPTTWTTLTEFIIEEV